MWTSVSMALMALLLSDTASASGRKRTVTIEACEATTSITSGIKAAVASPEILLAPSNASIPPVVIMSTVTVIPMPVGTVSGVFYPGFGTGTGVPSGIFWPGFATGSGAARPTGCSNRNGTGNHTHHHHNSTRTSSTSSRIPFFTLTNTGSVPLPTLISTITPEISSATPEISSTIIPTTSTLQPSSTTSTATPSTTTPANTTIPFLRGVNLGGCKYLGRNPFPIFNSLMIFS